MYNLSELETWHQHHKDPMQEEAANARLARQLQNGRPRGASRVEGALPRRVPTRSPIHILALALATFAIGTGTFIVTGILGGVAEGLSVSVGNAGHLVTVFAVTFALLSPILVAATGRVPRRRLLVTTLILFAAANAAAAAAPTFPLLLLTRVAAAGFAAICTPVALATASQLASPERKGQALSVTIGGISVAWVVGVPLGAMIVDRFGWRASFVLAAALALAAAGGVRLLLPAVSNPAPAGGLASRLAVVGRPVVLTTLAVTVLAMVSGFAVLTYVRPLLEGLTGFGGEGIGLMLLAFGLAGVAGSVLGGYGADHWNYRATVVLMLVALGLSLLSFSLLPALDVGSLFAIAGAGAAMIVWGAVVFALIPVQQHHLISVAPDERNGVLSLNSSAVYTGQGLGAGLGSLTLGQMSLEALGYAGALLAAVALIVLLLASRFLRDRDVPTGAVVKPAKASQDGYLGDRNRRVPRCASGERPYPQPCL